MTYTTVSGEANFHMQSTSLTIGGFTQPSVAKSLIELPQSVEKGLVQRFLWILPRPSYASFASLESADDKFQSYLGIYICISSVNLQTYPIWYKSINISCIRIEMSRLISNAFIPVILYVMPYSSKISVDQRKQ